MNASLANFARTQDYLPIITGALLTDLAFIALNNADILVTSKVLQKWYQLYTVSAVLCDTFIIVIGIILARFFYRYVFTSFSLVKFIGLACAIQIVHDILFYIFFQSVPRGTSRILDTFKDYAHEVSGYAILGDSAMMVVASLLFALLAQQSLNTNIIVLIVALYIMPYLIFVR